MEFVKKLDYFFVLRPMLFFPGWITLLAGYFISSNNRIFYGWEDMQAHDYLLIIKVLLLFASAMGASFLLNQLKDIETDRENNKLFIIAQGIITNRQAMIEIIVLIFISILLAFQISVTIATLIVGFIFLTGYLYNFKPFALKDSPIGSLAANSLMGWFAFAIGWSVHNPLSWDVITDALPYIFFNTALYFFTTLPDVPGDKSSGKRTIAVLYGLKKTIRIAFLFWLTSVVAAYFLEDWTIFSVVLIVAPFFMQLIRNYSLKLTVRTTKFSIFYFGMVICFKLPAFFILMLIGFFATKLYFKTRFNFNYPNFAGNSTTQEN